MQKRDDTLKEAVGYVKKVTKNKFYHSATIRKKMVGKYPPQIINQTIKYLEDRGKINDELFVESLISLFIKKGYGSLKFKQYLLNKDIPLDVYERYTKEVEEQSIENAYKINEKTFDKYQDKEKDNKIYTKFKYLGFSNNSISYIIKKEKEANYD